MAEHTGIEWCDATFNPWWGCERVSPGCAHCYADTLARRRAPGQQLWGDGHGFRFFGDKHWAEPLKWARTLPAKLGRRPRIFCASMADVFEERPELDEHRVRLYDLILRTPELDWLILTKRPELARDWFADGRTRRAIARSYAQHFEDGDNAFDHAYEEMARGLRNVWMGVSIENARFTWRADVLREIPAAVRFISAEPLIGSLFPEYAGDCDAADLATSRKPGLDARGAREGSQARGVLDLPGTTRRSGAARTARGEHREAGLPERASAGSAGASRAPLDLTGIDWVIVGGESGPKSRPFHLEHARELVAFAALYALDDPTAVFVKQLGAKPVSSIALYHDANDRADGPLKLRDRKGGDWDEWPADLRIREFPRSAA